MVIGEQCRIIHIPSLETAACREPAANPIVGLATVEEMIN